MAGAARRLPTLTGVKPIEDAHDKLKQAYTRTLRILAKMPAGAGYRVNTEAIVKNRMAIVSSTPDLGALEKKINCGCIEEVLRQAERELFLARNMINYKPWEPLVAEAPKHQFTWPPV
ncbi:NADH dehydrogenase [ubiquinone] 1 alpha subcomplex subunit 5-like [Mya arenaria]|uniref:NADH dehydrogenase [ubiquinone] 1 alpha subcomplex subunit 5-like n=1 Tax=Mya arenaria TaxID=6604 RepID=UPI0022E0C6CF|nr:NADH dehydrogenase [ubiquinone] 1 alpha subcomplex subunit 5-like [Mya arenaria]